MKYRQHSTIITRQLKVDDWHECTLEAASHFHDQFSITEQCCTLLSYKILYAPNAIQFLISYSYVKVQIERRLQVR